VHSRWQGTSSRPQIRDATVLTECSELKDEANDATEDEADDRHDLSSTDRDGGRHRRLRGALAAAWVYYERAKEKIPIESIKRVSGQRSSGIVLDYVAAATLDDDLPLLEIVGLG